MPRRRRREFADPEDRKLYEAKVERLRQEQREKDEEESKKRLEKRQREERQRELEEDRRRRQTQVVVSSGGSSESNNNKKGNNLPDDDDDAKKKHESKTKGARERSGNKLSLGSRRNTGISNTNSNKAEGSQERQSTGRMVDVNNNISSPASSVSMSQSQSQLASQNSLLLDNTRIRRRIGDSDDEDRKPAAASTNNNSRTTSAAAAASGPRLTAPKIVYRKRIQAESSSDSDSSSDDDEDDEPKRRQTTKPASGSSNNNNKRNAAQLDSDSSSDEDKPSPATATGKRQKTNSKDASSDAEPMVVEEKDNAHKDKLASPEMERDLEDDLMKDTPPKKSKKVNATKNTASPRDRESLSSPRNPMAIQKREQEQNLALQQQRQPPPMIDDSKLWDSDPDEVPIKITSKARARRGTKTTTRAPTTTAAVAARNVAVKPASPSGVSVNANSNSNSNDNNQERAKPADEDAVEEDDKELQANNKEQHPHFANPTFGPFENEPLVLKNLEDDQRGGHQVPASLSRYLPDFQREGIQFLYNTIANGNGAILGDDMGLGKTVQVISVISAFLGKTGTGVDASVLEKRKKKVKEFKEQLDSWEMNACLGLTGFKPKEERIRSFLDDLNIPEKMPILLVVPSSVLDNWAYEFDLWGHFSVAMYRDDTREGALDAVRYGEAEVMVVGHKLFGTAAHFKNINTIPWKLCVVDEFHVFKTPKGHNSKNLKKLTQDHQCRVLGMTGTPMQNRYEELHNLVDLVDDNRLGTLKEFMKNIANPIKLSRAVNASAEAKEYGERKRQELNLLLRPVYIQRKKTEVLKNMPVKIENVLLCPLSDLQRKVYEHILNLPDFLLIRGANTPCDCGVNKNYFAEYRRLRSAAEKIEYQRKNQYISRSKCCYITPPPGEENAVLWHYQHKVSKIKDDDPDEYESCKKCPTCLLLPALTVLYKLSSSIALIQFNDADKSGEQEARDKQDAFAKIAFPPDVLKRLPGRSHVRCDSALRNSDHFALSGKMKKLHELLLKIQKDKERVLLFSYSTQTLDIIQSYMESQSHTFRRIDGGTPSKLRQGLVNEFQNSDGIFCFLLSTRAAGVGLNLTAANQVIIFDCEWNPANDEQAQDRSFRIGQKKDVTVHRLVAQGTIDELKYLRQIYKLHLKQETFRSAEGSEAAPRSFLGVEKDKSRKGELFGMENLLSFSKDSSFMDKVWKTDKKRRRSGSGGLNGLSSLELAKDWGAKGESILEDEKQGWLDKKIDEATSKVPEDQQEDSQSGAKDDAYDHNDFFQQDRVHTEYHDPDNVMGGETQAVDDFVTMKNDASDNEDDPPNDLPPLAETASHSTTKVQAENGSPPVFGVAGYDSPSEEDNTDDDNTIVKSSSSSLTGRDALLQKAKRVASWTRGSSNFALCGVSAKEIRSANTVFSMADIYQPKAKKDS